MAASCGLLASTGINLDSFMSTEGHVRELFGRWSRRADASVVEGVMGLFDGAEKSSGSSAEIATMLGLPVVMVVDARSMAYSAAPLLYGFRSFDSALNLAGVIFNRVNTPSHYSYLEAAARDAGVEPLGYVPRSEAIAISERHLGLNTSASYDREAVINAMADHVEKTVDIDRLLALSLCSRPVALHTVPRPKGSLKIAVARDEAFNFLYHENLEVLARHGTIEWFSPLADRRLPEADLICLAGGYPELYAEKLSANRAMCNAIADYCQKGGRTYAECGGMMYLGKTLTLKEGTALPMCEVLDLDTTMEDARLTLGYRALTMEGYLGGELRGHEFHYSHLKRAGNLRNIATVKNARNEPCPTPVYRNGNTIASYIHLYWGQRPDFPGWPGSR